MPELKVKLLLYMINSNTICTIFTTRTERKNGLKNSDFIFLLIKKNTFLLLSAT